MEYTKPCGYNLPVNKYPRSNPFRAFDLFKQIRIAVVQVTSPRLHPAHFQIRPQDENGREDFLLTHLQTQRLRDPQILILGEREGELDLLLDLPKL